MILSYKCDECLKDYEGAPPTQFFEAELNNVRVYAHIYHTNEEGHPDTSSDLCPACAMALSMACFQSGKYVRDDE